MRKPEGKNHLENLGVDGRIILKWILEGWDGEGAACIQDRNKRRVLLRSFGLREM
jgi:hypothetical protein